MSILKDGTILNRNQYKITKFIAQGGFGITYLAEEIGYYKQSGFGEEYVESRNPETVVIKELYYNDYCNRDEQTGLISISNVDKKTEFQKLVKNQIDEGKTIRGLKHKNIVRTRDIFHENETAYMVMDYIESTDLEEMLKEKGYLDKETALKYIYQILDAVDYIHTKIDKKILHLDISPSNVLIDKGNDNAILIDFGSALSYDNVQNNITSTTSQIVTGRKKHYSPNEQGDIDNLKSFDATFDTYAVGATLFHLLTGEKPPLSSMVSTGREKIIPPSEFKKDATVSDYLDAVVIKSIAPFYNERYSSAEEFEKDLKKESAYNEQIQKINQLIFEKNIQEAFNQIKSTQQEFLKTSTLLKLEDDLKKEIELERKTREYNILFKKGSDMASAEEFELAIDYFSSAKEIFPEKSEIDEKIKFCQEKINLKLEEKRKAEEAAAKNVIDEKGETELFIPTTSKPEIIAMPEATQLMESPKTPEVKKENPIKVEQPKAEIPPKTETPKQLETPAMNPKIKSKNGVIIAAVVGLVAIGGILYAMGIFSENQNEIVNNENPITNDTIANKENVASIETPTDSTVILSSANPNEDWKSDFNSKFDEILNNEDTQSASQSIAQYKSLLSSIPADATSERSKINKRIDGLNKTIASEKEITDWNAAKQSNTEKSYQNYINKYPGGKYVSDARSRIANLKKDVKKEEKSGVNDANMAQYNKDLNWAKNMISVDGCEGCKANSTCQSQVVSKLKNALKYNPNGTEAKNLLNCVQ